MYFKCRGDRIYQCIGCERKRDIEYEFYFMSQTNQVFLLFVCVFVVFQQFTEKLKGLKMCKLW